MRIRNSQAATAAKAANVFVSARAIVEETLCQLAASFNSKAYALQLPSELVFEIASCLEEPKDRTAVSGTCRGWRAALLSDARLWNSFRWRGTCRDWHDSFLQFHCAVNRSFRGGHPVDVDMTFDSGCMDLDPYLEPLPHEQLHRLSLRRPDNLRAISWFPTFLHVKSLSISDLDTQAFFANFVMTRLRVLFPAVVNLHLRLRRFIYAEPDATARWSSSLQHLHLSCDNMYQEIWDLVVQQDLHTVRIDCISLSPIDYGLDVDTDRTPSLEQVFLSAVGTPRSMDFESLEPIARVTVASTHNWHTQPWSLLAQIPHPTVLSCRARPTSTAARVRVRTSLKISDGKDRRRHLQLHFSQGELDIVDAVQTWLTPSSFVVVKLDLQFVSQFLGAASFSFTSMRDLVVWFHPDYVAGLKPLGRVVVPALKRVAVCGTGSNPVDPGAAWFEWLLSGMYADAAAQDLTRPTLELVWPIRISDDARVLVQDYVSSVDQVWTRTV